LAHICRSCTVAYSRRISADPVTGLFGASKGDENRPISLSTLIGVDWWFLIPRGMSISSDMVGMSSSSPKFCRVRIHNMSLYTPVSWCRNNAGRVGRYEASPRCTGTAWERFGVFSAQKRPNLERFVYVVCVALFSADRPPIMCISGE
jgi:hypothetical protein